MCLTCLETYIRIGCLCSRSKFNSQGQATRCWIIAAVKIVPIKVRGEGPIKMRITTLKIENFRGVRAGFIRFGKHPVLVGDDNTGKTTLVEALTLVLGRDRLIRELTEHDFYGSFPQPNDRIK